jgi:hypothetical protein
LALGGADLAADLNAALAWDPMLFARSRIVQAAAAASIRRGNVPYLDIHDADGLARETAAAKAPDHVAKLAIHLRRSSRSMLLSRRVQRSPTGSSRTAAPASRIGRWRTHPW